MLCVEGISRALKAYLCMEKPPLYKTTKHKKGRMQQITVAKEVTWGVFILEDSGHGDANNLLFQVGEIRPFVVCAILRNVTFDQRAYDSFIELQDKLHNNICRQL